jgi:hypothetical protein
MSTRAFVVLVTDGTVIDYAPEIYLFEERAIEEAERWAWVLAGGGWTEISTPYKGRWEVAGRDVRLVHAVWQPHEKKRPWVGTFWTKDGYPEPEATILWGRTHARSWAVEPPKGMPLSVDVVEQQWMVAAIYRHRDEEAYAVAHLSKVVA